MPEFSIKSFKFRAWVHPRGKLIPDLEVDHWLNQSTFNGIVHAETKTIAEHQIMKQLEGYGSTIIDDYLIKEVKE